MPNVHIAVAVAQDGRLDDRQRAIFERAVSLACRDVHVVADETDAEGSRTVFDRDKGELRVSVEVFRRSGGSSFETIDLKIREYGMLVFHVLGRRLRERTAAKVVIDIPSYWEAILRFTS